MWVVCPATSRLYARASNYRAQVRICYCWSQAESRCPALKRSAMLRKETRGAVRPILHPPSQHPSQPRLPQSSAQAWRHGRRERSGITHNRLSFVFTRISHTNTHCTWRMSSENSFRLENNAETPASESNS